MNKPTTFLLLLSAMLMFSATAGAEEVTMTLDPAQSSIGLSGAYVPFPLYEQAPGSGAASYSGTITVDLDNLFAPTSIQILGSSAVAANYALPLLPSEGSIEPPVEPNPGAPAAANYGLLITNNGLPLDPPNNQAIGFAAIREYEYDISGDVEVVTPTGMFPSSQTMTIADGFFDTWTVLPDTSARGDLAGDVLTNASTTESSYVVAGTMATLTIPVFVHDFEDEDPEDGTPDDGSLSLIYVGQFVATAVVPEPSSVVIACLLCGLATIIAVRRRKK